MAVSANLNTVLGELLASSTLQTEIVADLNQAITTAAALNRAAVPFVVPLTDMRAAGTMAILGQTAGTPSGALGLTPGTFGTALPLLVGEAGATKTDVARFSFRIPDNFKSGGNITVTVNASEATATDGTLALNAYATTGGSNLGGALTGTMASTASNFTGTITATGLTGGQIIDCEISAVTVTSGTITINSITFNVDLNN